ncbi:LEAF RUST 10 DISEASE-RESISTANCE LOCUS RECEPTOR-LIKE PROTEIN KINASE-like 1.2 [Gastrolobium bilobum]|uniref:LEAF RUST 10 DISEASE-RESISTANCE LOCUS RECEPTOR-LIKE PROTEIN KINASE-like 1.2 n=1 Tax=Gastrolobium bilobum TaxID=150636 RepID=UPI002AB30CBF|nr:LEAF RUST 10 DISEASE-RESISTANCE LOCUS RECEPTOR-LIKE PROTEIN KINASE-like 1.2 [Gastrolobium bilobum]
MSKPLHSLLALSIILMTCYADSFNTSTICNPSVCGNISIRYPFWKRSNTTVAGEFCGYPDFGLECSENQPIITLPSDTYFVTDINYDNHSITLVDIDVMNQPCPRAKNNVTIANLPLSFSSLDLNLSFYFNCSSYPSYVDPIGCLVNDYNMKSYVFKAGDEADGYDWNRLCEEHVVVTVKDDEIDSNGIGGLISGFGVAMNKGFVLDWMKAVDCAECELYGGYCGYDQTIKQSRCICRDGSVSAKSCKKGTLILAC